MLWLVLACSNYVLDATNVLVPLGRGAARGPIGDEAATHHRLVSSDGVGEEEGGYATESCRGM